MAKSPKDPNEILSEISDDYKGVFGDDLVSIILYGSAAGKEYRPGKSDINLMIVLTEEGIDRLDGALKIVSKWQKKNVALPLFLTEGYVETSTDVFPIEYLNFQRRHLLVYGKDLLKELSFDPDLLRLQCEREIKGKLLLLREAFLESNGKGRVLRGVIIQSLHAFLAIFNALLFLKGEEVSEEKGETMKKTCKIFNLDETLFESLLQIRGQKIKPNDAEMNTIFKNYLREVRKLSKMVDTLGG